MKKKILSFILITMLLVFAIAPASALAYGPTDEILDYEITADVNEDDATVNLTYHIEWKVLDSDELGPLEWVSIGIPNSEVVEYDGLTDNISQIYPTGNFMYVYFDRKYYEGETVSFDFKLKQDYMYSMNALTEGETVYYFTPGWFDEIDVDKIVIRWNNDKAVSWDGPVECLIKDGYNTWTTSMPAGDTVSVKISYPNDAFGFDASKDYTETDPYGDDDDIGFFGLLLGLVLMVIGAALIIGVPVLVVAAIGGGIYAIGAGFSAAISKPKKSTIKRTKIVYYSTCPGCGASRVEGKDTCEYCGHTMIKEEEVLTEEKISEADRPAMKFKSNGTFHYSDSPDTYVRVHVVPPPPPVHHHHSGGGGKSHRGGSGGGHHSSCAHSSCACACASCACACACACAGGGRAGCTTKDFYKTGLKLKQLAMKKKDR